MCISAIKSTIAQKSPYPGNTMRQWRTFVEIIGGDELLLHQLKRQDSVNFWGAWPPTTPTAVLLCTLPRFESLRLQHET